jgi:hypothetical protein
MGDAPTMRGENAPAREKTGRIMAPGWRHPVIEARGKNYRRSRNPFAARILCCTSQDAGE